MLHELDKLHSDVGELLNLCAEAGSVPEEALSAEDKKYMRLGEMILKAGDGQLDKRTFLRMEKWMMCDEQACRYYVDFQILTAQLYEHFNKNQSTKVLSMLEEYTAAEPS